MLSKKLYILNLAFTDTVFNLLFAKKSNLAIHNPLRVTTTFLCLCFGTGSTCLNLGNVCLEGEKSAVTWNKNTIFSQPKHFCYVNVITDWSGCKL